jgi:hypothetical protein
VSKLIFNIKNRFSENSSQRTVAERRSHPQEFDKEEV